MPFTHGRKACLLFLLQAIAIHAGMWERLLYYLHHGAEPFPFSYIALPGVCITAVRTVCTLQLQVG